MNNRCFVIMPYHERKDVDGKEIDFDRIYASMIKKAVEGVPGLKCERCDDLDKQKPGWIHKKMLGHIFDDQVAIVDTSTLNPNVFYELGVRHALRRAVTVLIHRKGTSRPFNIAGLNSIEYEATEGGLARGREKIRRYIANGLKDPQQVDSLVYEALPGLQVHRGPRRLTKVQTIAFPLKSDAGRSVGLVTGDREDIKVGEIWVTSENTNMQMDSFYGKSTSATVRYLGARKDDKGIVEDTIGEELRSQMGTTLAVDPGTVIVTGAGALEESNKVKWIFHVAAVRGELREGYRPVKRIDSCVKNALRRASTKEFQRGRIQSILFPIFGTGPGGGDFRTHAETCITAAVEHLELRIEPIRAVYFYVWSDVDLEIFQAIARSHPGLRRQ